MCKLFRASHCYESNRLEQFKQYAVLCQLYCFARDTEITFVQCVCICLSLRCGNHLTSTLFHRRADDDDVYVNGECVLRSRRHAPLSTPLRNYGKNASTADDSDDDMPALCVDAPVNSSSTSSSSSSSSSPAKSTTAFSSSSAFSSAHSIETRASVPVMIHMRLACSLSCLELHSSARLYRDNVSTCFVSQSMYFWFTPNQYRKYLFRPAFFSPRAGPDLRASVCLRALCRARSLGLGDGRSLLCVHQGDDGQRERGRWHVA